MKGVIAIADGPRLSSTGMSPALTIDDVARIALDLPQVTEGVRHGNRTWFVVRKGFAWERPFSKPDLKRYGDVVPPEGPILAVRVASFDAKDVALRAHPEAFFSIPHFDGYTAVLIQMRKVKRQALEEAIVDGWLACAPKTLARQFVGR